MVDGVCFWVLIFFKDRVEREYGISAFYHPIQTPNHSIPIPIPIQLSILHLDTVGLGIEDLPLLRSWLLGDELGSVSQNWDAKLGVLLEVFQKGGVRGNFLDIFGNVLDAGLLQPVRIVLIGGHEHFRHVLNANHLHCLILARLLQVTEQPHVAQIHHLQQLHGVAVRQLVDPVGVNELRRRRAKKVRSELSG